MAGGCQEPAGAASLERDTPDGRGRCTVKRALLRATEGITGGLDGLQRESYNCVHSLPEWQLLTQTHTHTHLRAWAARVCEYHYS